LVCSFALAQVQRELAEIVATPTRISLYGEGERCGYVKNTKFVKNAFGIHSFGPNVAVRVDGSGAIGNSTGLSFSGGGARCSQPETTCSKPAAVRRMG
jgi:hypothetical protein